MNVPFFIVGLPRSRTAWLANLLTYGPAFCLHDGLADCASPEELGDRLAATGALWPGDADPGLPLFFRKIHARWPGARYVFIHRDPHQARAAYIRAVRGLQTPAKAGAEFDTLEPQLLIMKAALRGQHVLEVEFERLDRAETGRGIWEHCVPGVPFHSGRWELLNRLRVEVIAEQAAAAVDPRRLQRLAGHADRPSAQPLAVRGSGMNPLREKYFQCLREICGANTDALAWLIGWLNVTLTWDHIEDNDPIDKGIATWAFESVLLDWPVNEFWRAHGVALRPVLAATIEAWRDSNQLGAYRVKAWDVYSAVPCAVALLLGGREHVARVAPKLHALVRAHYDNHITEEQA